MRGLVAIRTIGSHPSNDIVIKGIGVAPFHCAIEMVEVIKGSSDSSGGRGESRGSASPKQRSPKQFSPKNKSQKAKRKRNAKDIVERFNDAGNPKLMTDDSLRCTL
jgi:hypothetical protein